MSIDIGFIKELAEIEISHRQDSIEYWKGQSKSLPMIADKFKDVITERETEIKTIKWFVRKLENLES